MPSWALMNSQLVGKCQTLMYISIHVGLSGFRSHWDLANSSPIISVVLALDGWKGYGEEGLTDQHLLYNVCLKCLH